MVSTSNMMEMVKTVKPTGMMDAETASATLREFVSDGLHSRMETDYPQCYIYLLYVLYICILQTVNILVYYIYY